MGEVHKLLSEGGKEAALKAGFERTLVEAAHGYLSDEENDSGFLFSGWAQAALPHKRLLDDQAWQVTTDRVTLVVEPGFRPSPDGNPAPIGVPYGSRARLILLYLQTEAIRNNSREVEMGRSLHAWLKRMEIPIGGMQMKVIRDQAERISRCKLSFNIQQGNLTGIVNQHILDTSMFSKDNDDHWHLLQKASLSQSFYNELKKHPVPVEEAAIRQCANNPAALDVYCWLAYRLHVLQKPVYIGWKALHSQFGRSVARLDHFKPHFRRALDHALSVYPAAQVNVDQRMGITLHPSAAPVISSAPRRPAFALVAPTR